MLQPLATKRSLVGERCADVSEHCMCGAAGIYSWQCPASSLLLLVLNPFSPESLGEECTWEPGA